MVQLRVGISGWRYVPWRGVFYPVGLAQRRELEFVAQRLNSVEINGSFYALQRPKSYASWSDETPDGFVFSVKGSRFITHMKKLRGVESALANFFASGLLGLGPKLGPLLWQLPPNLGYDRGRMTDFFAQLPRTTTEAEALAALHDERLSEDQVLLHATEPLQLRHCVEVRHRSFECADFVALLHEHNIALVVADTAGKWPMMLDVTSDFVYVRLHGADELYVSGYTDEGMALWQERVEHWLGDGLDCFIYFDNDVKVHAPRDAIEFGRRLGVRWPPAG